VASSYVTDNICDRQRAGGVRGPPARGRRLPIPPPPPTHLPRLLTTSYVLQSTLVRSMQENAKTFLEKRDNIVIKLEAAIHTALLTHYEESKGQISGSNIEVTVIGDN